MAEEGACGLVSRLAHAVADKLERNIGVAVLVPSIAQIVRISRALHTEVSCVVTTPVSTFLVAPMKA